MSDIRSFFGGGGNGAKPLSAKKKTGDSVASSAAAAPPKRKLVIQDDDEDEENKTKNVGAAAASAEAADAKALPAPASAPTPTPASTKDSSPKANGSSTKANGSSSSSSNSSSSSSSSSSNNASSSSAEGDSELESIPSSLQDMITWKAGESVPYLAVVNILERISAVSGRLEKESLFCKLFRCVILTTPSDLADIIYLVSNTVAPAFEGLELGIGDSLLIKAICESTGRNRQAVEEAYASEGDLGQVALTSRANQKTLSFAAKPLPLMASMVLKKFREITQTKGDKAQQRKVDLIKGLMVKGQGAEVKYIVRALQGNLRIGSAKATVLVSLGQAFVHSPSVAVRAFILQDSGRERRPGTDNEKEEEVVDDYDDDADKTSSLSFFKPRVGSVKSKVAGTDGDTDADPMETDEGEEKKDDADEEAPKSMMELISAVVVKEPLEAKRLRKAMSGKSKASIGREEREELAVIAVKRAFADCPSYTLLCEALLSRPLYQLYLACRLVPGVPISPMLAKPTKEIGEVLKRLSGLAFTMEYKYDGERAQVHLLPDGSVKIFSRNSLDDTNKYPDLAEVIRRSKHEGVTSCVIDCEVVAFDREKGCLLPFQVLSTRKRKVEDGEEDTQKVKVVLQGFDCLYLNGKSLLQESFRARRALLHASFRKEEGYFYFASGMDHLEDGDTAPIEVFMQEACTAACEGLMVKTLDHNATYEPSKRSLNWLKLKKDYIDGMGVCDSVDLVVIGGYWGKGKRTNSYGAYLMACYDPESDEFQSVCKVGTGFKDEELVRFTEKMREHALGSKKRPANYNVGDALQPDDWFSAKVVWELQAADLSKSSVHKGAIGRIDDRGIGLRFPRFIRERDDKPAEGATTAEQIADMYNSQDHLGVSGAGDEDDDDEGI